MLCFCRIVNVMFMVYRIFGVFPFVWSHKGAKCDIRVSKVWVSYSGLLVLALCYGIFVELNGFRMCTMEQVIGSISSISQYVLCVVLISCVIFFSKGFEKHLAELAQSVNEMLCEKSKRHLNLLFWLILSASLGLAMLFSAGTIWFGSQEILTAGNLWKIYIYMLPFLYFSNYSFFFIFTITKFSCFKGILLNVLQYETQHPCPEIDMKHQSHAVLLGLIRMVQCNEASHRDMVPPQIINSSKACLIEHMRLFHEKICETFRQTNQLTYWPIEFYLAMEIFSIFVQYMNIIFLFYSQKYLEEVPLFAYICWFLMVKQLILVAVFSQASSITYQSDVIRFVLLEYSTRHSNPALDLQLRIFFHKLRHQPTVLKAFGFDAISIENVLPISTFIFMHVVFEIQLFQII